MLLAVGAGPHTPAHAASHDALGLIDDCVTRLDRELDVGYARISARCPDLTGTLDQGPWSPWLPEGWKRPDNQLSASGLSELRTLLARATAPAVSQRLPPRPERVGAALAELAHSEPGRLSWWQRFREWVRTIMTARSPTDNSWLVRWFEQLKLSSSAGDLIVWGSLTLVVALAAGIVLNELRLAGLLGLPGRRGSVRAAQRAALTETVALADIERVAPEHQPGLLLELIVRRLAEQDRLPPARALTARELERRAQLPDESGRIRLTELVRVCERVRFSREHVSPASLTAALRSGRLLLAALDAPALTALPVA